MNKKYKCKVLVVPKAAKQASKEITPGTSYYRGFLVDNVYHSGKNGEIHYNVYFPDSYDGKKKMALYVTLPGYQGLYFQGVAENIKTEDFGFEAQKYNPDMVILDRSWMIGEKSRQTRRLHWWSIFSAITRLMPLKFISMAIPEAGRPCRWYWKNGRNSLQGH